MEGLERVCKPATLLHSSENLREYYGLDRKCPTTGSPVAAVHLEVLCREVTETLGGGAQLEKVGHWVGPLGVRCFPSPHQVLFASCLTLCKYSLSPMLPTP